MQNKMSFEIFEYIFENDDIFCVDETSFYFVNDPEEKEHMIGCLCKNKKSYWVGYCDIPDGCEYHTAKEMLTSKIFDGKSIKERWNEIEISAIGAMNFDDWLDIYGEYLR